MNEILEPKSTVNEALTILVFCFLIALVFNHFSKSGISLVYQTEKFNTVSDTLLFGDMHTNKNDNQNIKSIISTGQLRKIIELGNAVLIDARNSDAYNRLHIPSAINIPFQDVFNYMEILNSLQKDTLIIVYCEGGTCELSKNLIKFMKDMYFTRVYDYHEGIEGWQKENLNIEK